MIHMARAFGLDKKTGIDLPGEIEGRVPDQRWKQINLSGAKWYDGDTVNMSIGQGYMETPPMELAVMYGGFLNRGKLYRPHLLKEIRDPITNRVIRRSEPQMVSEVPVSPRSLGLIQDGMRAVVTRGTARSLQKYPVPIGGKTGTAQTRSRVKGKNHAWFVGYAPHGAPPEETIVVAVFVEYGVGGGLSAAPVAGEMLNAAFPDWTPQKTRELMERRRREALGFDRVDREAPVLPDGAADGAPNPGASPFERDPSARAAAPQGDEAQQRTRIEPGFVPGAQTSPGNQNRPQIKREPTPQPQAKPTNQAPANRGRLRL